MRQRLNKLLLGSLTALVCIPLATPAAAQNVDFDNVPNSQNPHDTPLTPQQALARLNLPAGFRATLFAAEPDVRQPIAITTDERGRLWVAENYTYAEAALNYDLALHDRIVIFEDSDHDGRFDRRKVFWDRGQKLTSVEVGFGGVWVLCAPHLLFIPDRNHDDVPDAEPEVLLDGFNDGSIRHNIVNGLKWGPDGWLYGRHGIQATSLVGKPGTPASQRVPLNCSIWRYHPTRRTFEVVTHGTTNSWGFDYDDFGQMFFINTVIGHLWHVVPGAHYRRMYGADFNPHLYQLIDQCADHYHWDTGEAWSDIRKGVTDTTSRAGGGHAHCGLMIYLGDNWPDRYRNGVFTLNLHGRRINHDRLVRRDAGYVGKHAPDFLMAGDPWFRGIELVYGPDGGVFIADWSDLGECHENDGVHRTSGRIYKITYGAPAQSDPIDLSLKSDLDLVALQLSGNDWYVRQARRLLQERGAAGGDLSDARGALVEMFEGNEDVTRKLRALWCLWGIGGVDEGWLVGQLAHPSEHVRVWAIRLLTDNGDPGSEVATRFARMAHEEPSGLVRLFLASAMQRLPLEVRWDVAAGLASHAEDAGDPALPLMAWYGIEPAVPGDAGRALQLVQESRIALLRRFVARRLTSELETNPGAVDQLVRLLEPQRTAAFQRDVLGGMNEALRGYRQAAAPESWAGVAKVLAGSADAAVRQAARELGVVFGDGRALGELREIVAEDPDPEARRSALRVLVRNGSEDLLPLLRNLVNDPVMSDEAIKGLAYYKGADIPGLILGRYDRLGPEGRGAAVATLAARPESAVALLEAVARGAVPAGDISAFQARQMRSLHDTDVDRLLAEHWGQLRDSSAEKKAEIARLRALLTPERLAQADLPAGRALFEKTCAKCHTLYGRGAKTGPDLTGSNRHNVDYLLENVVDPSATMINDFKMSVVVLDDGRVLNGVVTQTTPRTLMLQTQDELVTLPRETVEEITPQNVSLMPDGLLQSLSDEEVRDLIGYLSGKSQVALPEGEKG